MTPPTPKRGHDTAILLGSAAVTAAATWTVVRDYLAARRLRADREASPGPHLCPLELTPSGLHLNGVPIDPERAAERCIGAVITAHPNTTAEQRAAAVAPFAHARKPWLIRFW